MSRFSKVDVSVNTGKKSRKVQNSENLIKRIETKIEKAEGKEEVQLKLRNILEKKKKFFQERDDKYKEKLSTNQEKWKEEEKTYRDIKTIRRVARLIYDEDISVGDIFKRNDKDLKAFVRRNSKWINELCISDHVENKIRDANIERFMKKNKNVWNLAPPPEVCYEKLVVFSVLDNDYRSSILNKVASSSKKNLNEFEVVLKYIFEF